MSKTKIIRAYPDDVKRIEVVRRQLEFAGGPRRTTADAVRHIINGVVVKLAIEPEIEVVELEY